MLTNAERKLYKSLSAKKHRDEHGVFLVEGRRSVEEALASDFPIRKILATSAFRGSEDGNAVAAAIKRRRTIAETVTERDLDAITDTVHTQGIAAIVEMKKASLHGMLARARSDALLVALDAVADPGNLGTIIRTCDWFGADGIILGEGCVDVYNPKVVRGTMGSVFHLAITEEVNLAKAIPAIRAAGFAILATDVAGGDNGLHRPGKRLLLFGNEARGISEMVRRLADGIVTIPRFGLAESLNVSVACGIVLAEARRTQ